MFCKTCGKEIPDEAVICPQCGCMTKDETDLPETQQPKKESKTSMVLGIVGIIVSWLFALAGHIVSIIGIVTGIKAYKETGKMTGLILSIIGEVCAIFSSIIGAASFAAFF